MKSVTIKSLHDKSNDYHFWMSQTPQKRLEAIETLRQNYFSINQHVQQRFQRVFRIIDKTQG